MRSRFKSLCAAMFAVALAGVTATQAQTVWTGLGLDTEYSNTNNWSPTGVPAGAVWLNVSDTNNIGTINYTSADTNSVRSHEWYGGFTFNMSGGKLSDTWAGNTRRTWVGKSGTTATWNLTGGLYDIGHVVWVGNGGEGTINLDGGTLVIGRGGNGLHGSPVTVSMSLGNSAGTIPGTFNLVSGEFRTRVGVEVGHTGLFNVQGAGMTQIGIGEHNTLDGDWFHSSNGVLQLGISTNGITPINLQDDPAHSGTPLVKFEAGAMLDIGFIDGYSPASGSWPVMYNTNGQWTNLGFVPAPGVDTNLWGAIISNDVLYVGYNLGWPFGEEVLGPPPAQRTLYWTAGGGDTSAANPTNWVLDVAATNQATWGPYDNDIWRLADSACVGVATGVNYIINYEDGDAVNAGQRDLEVGVTTGAGGQYEGTFNHNSGSLTFTSHTSSRQEFGLNFGGTGTLNLNDGTLSLNAARFGINGGTGNLTVNGGTLNISRNYGTYSLWVGHGSGSTANVTFTGGRMFTRGPVKLGDSGGLSPSTFAVEGSVATTIGIGSNGSGANAIDGAWHQYAGGVLKARFDAGGITPITIVDKLDDTNSVHMGNVHFYPGATLDVDYLSGVSNIPGPFDVMVWDGSLVDSNLAFAASVDTNAWSFEFVDTDATNGVDTLRVHSLALTPTVDPNITAYTNNGSTITLAWDSEALMSYNVLSKAALSGTWTTNVAAIPSAGTTTSTTNVVPSGSTEEFFLIEAYY